MYLQSVYDLNIMAYLTVHYSGGIGNVLFEIAAAIAYSRIFNRTLVLCSHPEFPKLDKCTAKSIGLDESEFQRNVCEVLESSITEETQFPEGQNIMLRGFYQRYKIFDKFRDHVLDVIGFAEIKQSAFCKINVPNFKQIELFQSEKSNSVTISLHIRRGDYVNLRCYFLLFNEYYYKRALLKIIDKIHIPEGFTINVLCFYQDVATEAAYNIINALETDADLANYPICYHHFNDIVKAAGIDTLTSIDELTIMSLCKHNIICNSTYGWWAAYINDNPEKIVCYPDEYFNHILSSYLSPEGMHVDEWIKIQSWNPVDLQCDCR